MANNRSSAARPARPQSLPTIAAVSAALRAVPPTTGPEPASCGDRTAATSEAAAKTWQSLPPDLMIELLFVHLQRFWSESDLARIIDSANVIYEHGPHTNKAAQPSLTVLRDSSEIVEFWNLVERSATDMVLQLAYVTARLVLETKHRAGKRSPSEQLTVEDAPHVQAILRPELAEVSVAAVVLKPVLPTVRDWLILGMKLEKEWRTAMAKCLPSAEVGKAAETISSAKGAVRKTAAEYNVLARNYLKENPEAGVRELRKIVGCGFKTLYKLEAFIAVRGELGKGRRPKGGRKPKAISLTTEMEGAVTRDEQLARLVKEQRRDDRTQRVYPRERM